MLYFVRAPAAIFFFIGVSVVGTFIFLFRPFNPDNTRLAARIYSWGGTRILGIKLNLHDQERAKNMPPSVVVANHQDNLDLFVCGAVIPKRTVSVGKKSLLLIPGFGMLYWLAGSVLIDRKNSKNSKNAMNASTEALTDGNRSIWVFAEGTRNKGENILPFKKGAFRMAIEAGVPVVPICVSSYAGRLKLNKRVSGTVDVKVLEPISTEGLSAQDCDQLMDECWKKMKLAVDQLDQQSVQRALG